MAVMVFSLLIVGVSAELAALPSNCYYAYEVCTSDHGLIQCAAIHIKNFFSGPAVFCSIGMEG